MENTETNENNNPKSSNTNYSQTTKLFTRTKPEDGAPRGKMNRFRKKVCRFCENSKLEIDYKRTDVLVQMVSNKGKIFPRRMTGTCARHQRDVARQIKRARQAGFLPFSVK